MFFLTLGKIENSTLFHGNSQQRTTENFRISDYESFQKKNKNPTWKTLYTIKSDLYKPLTIIPNLKIV